MSPRALPMIGQIESPNGNHARIPRHSDSSCFVLRTIPAKAFRDMCGEDFAGGTICGASPWQNVDVKGYTLDTICSIGVSGTLRRDDYHVSVVGIAY